MATIHFFLHVYYVIPKMLRTVDLQSLSSSSEYAKSDESIGIATNNDDEDDDDGNVKSVVVCLNITPLISCCNMAALRSPNLRRTLVT